MRRRQPDPETLADVLCLMQACGYITVESNPHNDGEVFVRPAPRLLQMIDERGVTLDNFTADVA